MCEEKTSEKNFLSSSWKFFWQKLFISSFTGIIYLVCDKSQGLSTNFEDRHMHNYFACHFFCRW